MRSGPVEPGKDAGERPGEARDTVGDDRQSVGCEATRIAVGVEYQVAHLRSNPPDDPRKHRFADQQLQAFVAPAHAPGLTAGEQQSDDG
jgi:hypothetical protein